MEYLQVLTFIEQLVSPWILQSEKSLENTYIYIVIKYYWI